MNFNNTEYQTQPNESVLDLLLRHAKQINYSCKNGHCQSCILQVIEGNVESAALKDLKNTAIKQGHFLACQQKAHLIKQATYADIQSLFSPARLIDKSFYCDDICRIQIETTTPLYYYAGQFVNLKNPEGVIRSYSLASLPAKDHFLELHIRRKKSGQFSHWISTNFNLVNTLTCKLPPWRLLLYLTR